MHRRFAAALDEALDRIAEIQRERRAEDAVERPRWPMLVLRTPKGWTGRRWSTGKPVEGTWRAHQVPLAEVRDNPAHLRQLEEWLRSYRPEELFDESGRLVAELRELAPAGRRRMSANPHANGGELLRDLVLPDFREYAVDVPQPGKGEAEATRVLGGYLRDVIDRNRDNFRLFGPDETASNRLDDVFSVTGRTWLAATESTDEGLSPDGRVMEILSEHLCQGWLEGYLLTGPTRALHQLRGVHPHRRLDVQPAREVAEDHAAHPVAPADRVAELPAQLARLAPGPQRLLPPGSGLHRPRREQEGRGHPGLPAA